MTSAISSDIAAQPATAPHPALPQRRPYLTAVPDSLPPYDDERTARSRLRLLRSPGSAWHPAPRKRPATPMTVCDGRVPGWSTEADVGARATATTALPAAERSAKALARALVEVMSGLRPLAQLRVHCAPAVFAGLERTPVRRTPASLGSVHVSEPADGVAEVTTVVRSAGRARAIAFRLEGVDGRWRITALQMA